MKIVLGSTSQINIDAVMTAVKDFGLDADVLPVKAKSQLVREQLFDEETYSEAENRASHAARLFPGDIVLAIESGIFQETNGFFVYAIVLAMLPTTRETFSVRSEGLEIPKGVVFQTIFRGGDWTCEKILAELKLTKLHDDSHQSLNITGAVKQLFEQLSSLGVI